MAVIIEEFEIDILPGQSAGGEAVANPPAEDADAAKLIELLELARERGERLSCD